MRAFKRRMRYVVGSVAIAVCYFIASYYLVFLDIANENPLVATMWNIAFIFFILIGENVEKYIIKKTDFKIGKGKLSVLTKALVDGASFKAGLYCFYVGLLVCYAIVMSEPSFPMLGEMKNYFSSVEYGILILIATDGFLGQVFKDLDEK